MNSKIGVPILALLLVGVIAVMGVLRSQNKVVDETTVEPKSHVYTFDTFKSAPYGADVVSTECSDTIRIYIDGSRIIKLDLVR